MENTIEKIINAYADKFIHKVSQKFEIEQEELKTIWAGILLEQIKITKLNNTSLKIDDDLIDAIDWKQIH